MKSKIVAGYNHYFGYNNSRFYDTILDQLKHVQFEGVLYLVHPETLARYIYNALREQTRVEKVKFWKCTTLVFIWLYKPWTRLFGLYTFGPGWMRMRGVFWSTGYCLCTVSSAYLRTSRLLYRSRCCWAQGYTAQLLRRHRSQLFHSYLDFMYFTQLCMYTSIKCILWRISSVRNVTMRMIILDIPNYRPAYIDNLDVNTAVLRCHPEIAWQYSNPDDSLFSSETELNVGIRSRKSNYLNEIDVR